MLVKQRQRHEREEERNVAGVGSANRTAQVGECGFEVAARERPIAEETDRLRGAAVVQAGIGRTPMRRRSFLSCAKASTRCARRPSRAIEAARGGPSLLPERPELTDPLAKGA